MIAAMHALGWVSSAAYRTTPVPPFGVPVIVSNCFWAGLYGAVFGLLFPRFTWPSWLCGLLLGLIAALVGWFIVAPLKGVPIAGGWVPVVMLRSIAINGFWGIGVGLILPPASGLFAGTPYENAPPDVQRNVIVSAQMVLARRGLFRKEIDGRYGPDFEFSLRAFQSRVGLPITGRLGLETLAALELLPGANAPFYAPRRRIWREPPVRGEWIRP